MELIYHQMDQGSDDWKKVKLGVPSGSFIKDVLAKKGTDTRANALAKLIGQIIAKTTDEINGKALEHGTINEPAARAAYEFETGKEVEEVGFIYCPTRRIGCSPDGLIKGEKRGLEIKNPLTLGVHARTLHENFIKPEYIMQVQFSMYVTGFESWDFCSYHSAFKSHMIKIITLEPDRKLFERFDNELPEFMKEIDDALERLSLKWGSQWV